VSVSYATQLPSPTSVVLCTALVGTNSSYSCSGSIPTSNAGPPGAHQLTATGQSSALTATATFTLLPSVTVAPNTGPAGTGVTVSGSHFAPNEKVSVTWTTNLATPSKLSLCKVTATASGDISCSPTIPTVNPGPAGAHVLTATGATSKQRATTTFTLQ
jgi:hypothetical protein